MSSRKFQKMSDAELAAYNWQDEDEAEVITREKDFRQWCRENDIDPDEDGSREHYKEATDPSAFWDNLDDDDREGWEHNMNKD